MAVLTAAIIAKKLSMYIIRATNNAIPPVPPFDSLTNVKAHVPMLIPHRIILMIRMRPIIVAAFNSTECKPLLWASLGEITAAFGP